MKKYDYYIKTEQEFIDEFGEKWRDVRFGFLTEMNCMLGLKLENYTYRYVYSFDTERHIADDSTILDLTCTVLYVNLDGYNWTISNEMIKQVLVAPTYNDKRELVYD